MMVMRIAIALLALAACGPDDVDLTGVYRVDSAIGSAPCGTDATIEFAAFVKFSKMELFGQEYFSYDGCADDTATECSSIGGLIGGFFEPIDDGWLGRSSFSSGGGGDICLLGIGRQTALLKGNGLTIEVSGHEEEVPGLTTDECSPDEAEQRGEAMPCVSHSLIEATKI
jgi:hypothetical protein